MKINVNINVTGDQERELRSLLEKFEKENSNPKKVIDYVNGWVISAIHDDYRASAQFTTARYTNCCYDLGLYAPTKKLIEKKIAYLKVQQRLQEWADICKEKIDWENFNQEEYYIYCDLNDKRLYINTKFAVKCNDIYFTDKEILKRAISDIGEDVIIKDYFQVEEKTS